MWEILPYVAVSFRLCLSDAKNLEGKKGDSIIYILYLQLTKQLAVSGHPAVWHHTADTSEWLAKLFSFIKIFCSPIDNIWALHMDVHRMCMCLHTTYVSKKTDLSNCCKYKNAGSDSSLTSCWTFLTVNGSFPPGPMQPSVRWGSKTEVSPVKPRKWVGSPIPCNPQPDVLTLSTCTEAGWWAHLQECSSGWKKHEMQLFCLQSQYYAPGLASLSTLSHLSLTINP